MKINIISLVFGGLMMLMTSCSSDVMEEIKCEPEAGSTVLQLEINKNKESMSRGLLTSTSFQEGDEVMVIVTNPVIFEDETGHKHKLIVERKATLTNGKWVITPTLDFSEAIDGYEWADEINVKIAYPYDKVSYPYLTNPEAEELFWTDQLLSQTDFLSGYNTVKKNNAHVEITCNHDLSCLTFQLHNNSDKTVAVENFEIKQQGEASFLLSSGWLPSYYNSGISYTMNGYSEKCNIEIPAGESRDIDLLLGHTALIYDYVIKNNFPHTTFQIELTVNGSPVNFEMKTDAWSAGERYVYPVKLPSDLPERQPKKIYMYDTYNGKHVYYSDINVGATSESDYGRLFGWGDPTGEKIMDELSLYPTANPPQNIAGTEYDIATVNWGGNWRMPSNGDIWALRVDSESEWTTMNGVKGVKVTSTVTGESIFIPSAPSRTGSSIVFTDQSFYWLSDLNTDDTSLAQTLYFQNSTSLLFYPTAGQPRYKGLPVRAIWIDD